jgi:hypothetical protein
MMTRITLIPSASDLPTTGKKQKLRILFNNEGLDEQEGAVGESETICLATIFGGTSVG